MLELNIDIKNKHYSGSDNIVLENIKFTVKQSEFVAVIGPSGCGKTTLLNMIGGLESCKSQEVSYKNNQKENNEAHHLGYIFQQPRLMPWLTVKENIELVLQPSQFHKVEHLLEQVGLANKGAYFPNQLSGGMQRRVGIARAIAISPQVLLLDEPFNSLDAPTATRLRQLLLDLCSNQGITVIFVTHDLSEAIYLADRIIFLSAPPSNIIHQCVVGLPRPRKESGVTELEWQSQLMSKLPNILSGRID